MYLNAAKIKTKKKGSTFFFFFFLFFFLTFYFEIVRRTQPSLTRCAVYPSPA